MSSKMKEEERKKVIRTYPEMPGVTKRPGVYSSNSLNERSIGKCEEKTGNDDRMRGG